MDNILESRELQVERKHFFIEFRENDRGRFLKITEEAHGRRNSVIIPSTGLEEFGQHLRQLLSNFLATAKKIEPPRSTAYHTGTLELPNIKK